MFAQPTRSLKITLCLFAKKRRFRQAWVSGGAWELWLTLYSRGDNSLGIEVMTWHGYDLWIPRNIQSVKAYKMLTAYLWYPSSNCIVRISYLFFCLSASAPELSAAELLSDDWDKLRSDRAPPPPPPSLSDKSLSNDCNASSFSASFC